MDRLCGEYQDPRTCRRPAARLPALRGRDRSSVCRPADEASAGQERPRRGHDHGPPPAAPAPESPSLAPTARSAKLQRPARRRHTLRCKRFACQNSLVETAATVVAAAILTAPLRDLT